MYEVKSAENGGFIVTVVGFVGKFKNWRSMNQEDYEWVRLENTWKTSDREKVEAIIKK